MRQMMKGNEAIAEAAVQAGCRYYFGYPITPQSEIPEYMSRRLPEVGGVFLQAESEIAAINMVYGAAGAGARAMTSSSSPGICPQAGRHQLHCRRAAALRGGEHRARRPGPGLDPARAVGLLPGHARRRPRRLPRGGVRARVRAGGRGADADAPLTWRISTACPP